jgi:hypothetical protein
MPFRRGPTARLAPNGRISPQLRRRDRAMRGWPVAGLFVGLCARACLPGLVGPNALSALLAFKHMNDNSAFRFHDRFEESEPSGAEAAVMV